MNVVIQQLLSPLVYLRIVHPSKAYFDWIVPAVLVGAFVVVWIVLPVPVALRGSDGVIASITEFVKFLAGFYITALAAIATFDRASMDELMDNAPTLKGAPLTRRRFLARMFGYLAFMSIGLYALGVLAGIVAPSFLFVVENEYVRTGARYVFLLGYGFLAANLLTTTLLSLYFLSDRIIRTTPQVIPKPRDDQKRSAA